MSETGQNRATQGKVRQNLNVFKRNYFSVETVTLFGF